MQYAIVRVLHSSRPDVAVIITQDLVCAVSKTMGTTAVAQTLDVLEERSDGRDMYIGCRAAWSIVLSTVETIPRQSRGRAPAHGQENDQTAIGVSYRGVSCRRRWRINQGRDGGGTPTYSARTRTGRLSDGAAKWSGAYVPRRRRNYVYTGDG